MALPAISSLPSNRRERGFSLIETLVAVALLITIAVSLTPLLSSSQWSNDRARSLTVASMLAAEKMEQLRSLSWAIDAAGLPSTDAAADLSRSPERPSGGSGLRRSPADALERNTAGYCDFLDAGGAALGAGSLPPLDTAYVRRWSVTPLPADPERGLVLQVRVLGRGAGSVDDGRRSVSEARLVSVRARTTS